MDIEVDIEHLRRGIDRVEKEENSWLAQSTIENNREKVDDFGPTNVYNVGGGNSGAGAMGSVMVRVGPARVDRAVEV